MLKGPFLDKNFIGSVDDFESSSVVLLGMPFDGTCSNRAGARFAPQQIRVESVGIETYSPTFDACIEDKFMYDAGDLEFPFGNPQRVLDIIQENVEQIYASGKKVLGVGGEHLVTYATFGAIRKFYDNLVVIQFDAHTDLRAEYLGEELTHAGVMYKIGSDIGFENIKQVGIRSGEKPEYNIMKKFSTQLFDKTELKCLEGKNVFLTIDLDVLELGCMSGVGTQEAGGMPYNEFLSWLKELSKYNVIGADVVELAPDIDPTRVSTATACKVIREVLMLL